MKRLMTLLVLSVVLASSMHAQPLVKPFPFTIPSYDSTPSPWLPSLAPDNINAMGVLKTLPDGHLGYTDGTRARFVGVSMIQSACFPDSLSAIVTANHLRKLGVNMVRFNYFDYSNFDGASTLAPGNRSDTLSTTQMKRLDWFLFQLKRNGIRAHFVVKARNAPRRDDGVPTWDSVSNYAQYLYAFSGPLQQMQMRYMTRLFTHQNPYTGMRYADDPEIALLTVTDQSSIMDHWINNRVNQRTSYMSYHQSRMIDTLFANFLRARHGSTNALRSAYWEGSHTVGPNLVKNPGFESFTDNWTLSVGEGAQANPVIVQGPDVAPSDGPSSLRVAVRKVSGVESRLYLEQLGVPMTKNAIYRLRFRAKTDSASGRQVRVVIMRGSTPYDNFGINETVSLTTQWQTFDFTFRSLGTDTLASILRIYMGRTMGDVFLDGFSVEATGREGLTAGEALETSTVARARFTDAAKISLPRMYDQMDFYDSLGRAYFRTMRNHLRSLGVTAPIAGTNSTSSSFDTWEQSEYDFTAETSQWDFNGTRAGMPSSDSTWVIRNYSVLRFRDQKIPEFARNAFVGKPFIAEQYLHVFPNAHRSEMMLFMPAYTALHDWDGLYLYAYSDRNTELADRRRVFKDDYVSIIGDPSVTALLPQVSAALRSGWIAPAKRMIRIQHDAADLRYGAVTYPARGTFGIDGTFQNVVTLVTAVRVDSVAASRHYTTDDYYATIPSDDNIQSETGEIALDMTKGIMQVNTPRLQGASGALNGAASIRTDNLGVSWIDGGGNATYLWSTLDGNVLDSARRSLLTISTRSLNTGAIWQFGDSSIGKNWGTAPTLMEATKLGVNLYTSADSVIVHPLDSLGRPIARTISAVRNTSGSWRVTLDLEAEQTPWFGIEQWFGADSGTTAVPRSAASTGGVVTIGAVVPTPSVEGAAISVDIPAHGQHVSALVVDMLGRTVLDIPEHVAPVGRSVLDVDVRGLSNGTYVCVISIGGTSTARRLVVQH